MPCRSCEVSVIYVFGIGVEWGLSSMWRTEGGEPEASSVPADLPHQLNMRRGESVCPRCGRRKTPDWHVALTATTVSPYHVLHQGGPVLSHFYDSFAY